MLISHRIAGLREHNGEVVGDATRLAIIDRATHDRLVGLLDDPSFPGRCRSSAPGSTRTRSSAVIRAPPLPGDGHSNAKHYKSKTFGLISMAPHLLAAIDG
jgi:hypothetical protein